LPDADGPGYVSLNGGFREANRSLIGQKQSFITYKSTPWSRRSRGAVSCTSRIWRRKRV